MTYRVADYIADALVRHGVTHVFTVTGGGAMHLNHAFSVHPKLTVIYCHHEQACGFAAEGFYRATGRMAAVNVTTGPGALNVVTAVHAAYVDSIPMVVISGQVKSTTMARSQGIRQLGDQECDITDTASKITKWFERPQTHGSVHLNLDQMICHAASGRPGPVWLDIPIDVQACETEPEKNPDTTSFNYKPHTCDQEIFQVVELLRTTKRPVIYVGQGIRASGQHATLLRLLDLLQIPCVTTWNCLDLIPNDHPCYAGRPGTVGTRPGNFAVQNADLLLILGCRLNIRQISYAWHNFAPHSYKIMVDVDAAEMDKHTLKIDMKVHADLRDFMPRLLEQFYKVDLRYEPDPVHLGWIKVPDETERRLAWRKQCQKWVTDYPIITKITELVNPYIFAFELFGQLPANATVVCGDGTASVVTFQAATVQAGQRVWHNSGSAPMGYDLPAAFGAAIADPSRLTVCVTGDGSIMLNLQELQSIVGHQLPIKIFLLNNGGYRSIEQTQQAYFPDSPRHGCGPASGLTFPEFKAGAEAFGLTYYFADSHEHLEEVITVALETDGPVLCEIFLDETVPFAPKLAAVRQPDGSLLAPPLEDMSPLLPREELAAIMTVCKS